MFEEIAAKLDLIASEGPGKSSQDKPLDLDFGALNTAASWRQKTLGFFGMELKATENILGMYRFVWIAYQVEYFFSKILLLGCGCTQGLGGILRLGGDMVWDCFLTWLGNTRTVHGHLHPFTKRTLCCEYLYFVYIYMKSNGNPSSMFFPSLS